MLLAVFSDSHGTARHMDAAVAACKPDCVIFLGDGVRDAERVRLKYPETRFVILRGNCDREPGYEDSALLKLEGVGIFAAHGHEHGVRFGMDKFCTSVKCSTHRPLWQELYGIQIVNPGSVGSAQHPTFALIRLENGRADCRILDAMDKEGDAG